MENGTLALILTILFCLILAGVLIWLYKTKRITLSTITSIGLALEQARQIFPIDTPFERIVRYAWKAVNAVEQLVKSGQLDKTDEARRIKAAELVELYATIDGMPLSEKEAAAVAPIIEGELPALPATKAING